MLITNIYQIWVTEKNDLGVLWFSIYNDYTGYWDTTFKPSHKLEHDGSITARSEVRLVFSLKTEVPLSEVKEIARETMGYKLRGDNCHQFGAQFSLRG